MDGRTKIHGRASSIVHPQPVYSLSAAYKQLVRSLVSMQGRCFVNWELNKFKGYNELYKLSSGYSSDSDIVGFTWSTICRT